VRCDSKSSNGSPFSSHPPHHHEQQQPPTLRCRTIPTRQLSVSPRYTFDSGTRIYPFELQQTEDRNPSNRCLELNMYRGKSSLRGCPRPNCFLSCVGSCGRPSAAPRFIASTEFILRPSFFASSIAFFGLSSVPLKTHRTANFANQPNFSSIRIPTTKRLRRCRVRILR
jgi:hypothetical protein